ncbi:NADPH-dependent FMN reductase [Acididesulfobacillus acetoxydans]|uniref:Multimeric flavodoxin WrbA n=1 Tax=Acididesulfobacillus acetoxydans TaxID=1561005 RepID=A0A8S0W8F9_9FIRM|nr:flavodoxin family protein [Acididesulfobacillus acetoxydans]CAA7601819.1 NADPH-dependent FMN reductase [Acididesulfobacillus acetoxydans]CEJ09335.1 Multimeric flavodoxin WrbA [Acididesulfobacillus acetoxydans]
MTHLVLGIAGSPRQGSNSAWLLEQAMQEARERGHRTETIYLSKLTYSPCRGCGACESGGECVIRDDMQALQQKILAANRIIVATPIFFMGLNAQTKAMIDRMQPFWARKYLLHTVVADRAERRGLFVSTAGTKLKDVFACARKSIQVFFNMVEVEYGGECLFPGVDKAGEIVGIPGAAERVQDAVTLLLS